MPNVEFSLDFLGQAAALVRRRAGLAFDLARQPILEAGLRTAMQRSGTRSPDRYLDRLGQEEHLLDDLLAEITIGETYFFRDREQFAVLRDRILPDLLRGWSPGMPVRIWSAGCASGEEPYSLAIALHQLGRLADAHILGTDISRPMLRRAQQARYSRWSLRGVPEEIVETYFKRAPGDRFVLIPEIREAVKFRQLNLAGDDYPSLPSGAWDMDLVLCRNVLIYFAADRITEVAGRLLDSLTDRGWLLLGSADPLVTELGRCRAEVTTAGLVYRRARQPSRVTPMPVERPAEILSVPAAPFSAPPPAAPEPVAEPVAEAARWYAAREYRRAADCAAAALGGGTDTVTLRTVLINSLVNCGEFDEAEKACRAGRDRHGACADLAALHAFVLLEAGHHREAEMTARQALYLDPGLPVAHLALGTALVRLRNTLGARRAFRNAERLLAALPSDTLVPGADDEPAGRLVELARTQLALLHESAS